MRPNVRLFDMTSTSSSKLPLPQGPFPKPRESASQVDTSKRYDVYCSERHPSLVVYRNVLFKSRSKLLSQGPYDVGGEFLELEHANGQTVFLALHSVISFCVHGVDPGGHVVAPK